jgi:phosphohistidine phosphatase
MPTCGIFAIKIEIDKWDLFREGEKKFWFFDYPKLDL